ncbi:MAG: class II aldolase/adducin family protein [Anaerolineae bacterium]|nr:class II aldolase/adducin family protein [Anaerolineae bacterium]
MTNTEGVIKYHLDYTPAPPLPAEQVREINAWRKILYLLQLIGQDPERYGGYGFGNISRRLDGPRFVISGTQTGHLPELTAAQYATVLECDPVQNRLVGEGPVHPSAESLTHGTVYALDAGVQWVMHAHSPHIWQHAEAMDIPLTAADVPYGSPELAAEVEGLFRETEVVALGIFAMAGHEDGIVTFGRTAEAAGAVMLTYLSRAFQLDI